MSLHPKVEKEIEAGVRYLETTEEFARRIALRAVELEREEIMKTVGNWMLSVENCEDAVRWHAVGGTGNAVSGAMNKLREAIRRRGKP